MLLAHGGLPCSLENPQTLAFFWTLLYYVYPAIASIRAYLSSRNR